MHIEAGDTILVAHRGFVPHAIRYWQSADVRVHTNHAECVIVVQAPLRAVLVANPPRLHLVPVKERIARLYREHADWIAIRPRWVAEAEWKDVVQWREAFSAVGWRMDGKDYPERNLVAFVARHLSNRYTLLRWMRRWGQGVEDRTHCNQTVLRCYQEAAVHPWTPRAMLNTATYRVGPLHFEESIRMDEWDFIGGAHSLWRAIKREEAR